MQFNYVAAGLDTDLVHPTAIRLSRTAPILFQPKVQNTSQAHGAAINAL